MRISLLTPGITPYVIGGLQRHSFNLVKHLARLGVEIDLYHTDFSDAKDIDALEGLTDTERKKINSIAIAWPKSDNFPGHYVRELKHFSATAYRHYQQRPVTDFIIGKSLTTWHFGEAKRCGVALPPIGVNFHGFEMFQSPANIKALLENWLLRPDFYHHAHKADYLFSYGGRITKLIQERLQVPSEQIIETPGGIDSSWLVNQITTISKPLRFVFVGRYERRKGIQELHAAIQANPAWQNQASFRFIGPIPEDKQLFLPLVSYAGSIRDESLLRNELCRADVLLCPSHSEGMPNVILEAMASGLAVLATDVGAVRLLVNSSNGIRLPQVSVEGISKGINQLLKLDENQLQKCKQTSLKHVQSFTWDHIALSTLDRLQNIILDNENCSSP